DPRNRAPPRVQPQLAHAARHHQPDVPVADLVRLDAPALDLHHLRRRHRDLQPDRLSAAVQPLDVLLALEDLAPINPDPLEDPVPVPQAVVVHAHQRLALGDDLPVHIDQRPVRRFLLRGRRVRRGHGYPLPAGRGLGHRAFSFRPPFRGGLYPIITAPAPIRSRAGHFFSRPAPVPPLARLFVVLGPYFRTSARRSFAAAAITAPTCGSTSSCRSVRSGSRNRSRSVTDFFPAPTCLPR